MASFKKLLADLSPSRSTPGSVARAFRRKLELSLKDVETISGIKESNLSAYENDRKDMTKKTAEILSAVYGIQAWLLLFPNGETEVSERTAKIAQRAEKFLAKRDSHLRRSTNESSAPASKLKARSKKK